MLPSGSQSNSLNVQLIQAVVVQAMQRLQLRSGEVDRREPAILVVDRAYQHRDVAAVVAPVDRRAAAVAVGLDAHVAVALERILLRGLAQRRERIVGDARQRVVLEFADLAAGDVDQPQLVRHRRVAADARAHFLEFLVARFGHVFRHLAGGAGFGVLGLGDDEQPACVRRQRAVADLNLVAEIDRRRHARRIGPAPVAILRILRVAARAVVLQRADQAQLAVAQVVRFRRGGRILFRLDDGRLRDRLAGPAIPVVADAPHQAAVAAPLRARLVDVAARELRQARRCAGRARTHRRCARTPCARAARRRPVARRRASRASRRRCVRLPRCRRWIADRCRGCSRRRA